MPSLPLILALFLLTPDPHPSLTIRFHTPSHRFQIGQVIPVDLIFRSPAPKTFGFNTRSYDRTGRLGIDAFEVTPPGRDPLFAYYHNPLMIYIGGGFYSMLYLDDKPQIVHDNLNEWVAIDKPGHYTLRVTSSRVSRPSTPNNRLGPLTSNPLEFDIVEADPSWQQQTLAQATSELDSHATKPDVRAEAEATLRYLGTPASIRELVRQLGKPNDHGAWNFTAGLLGSRDQTLVQQELEARLADPDYGTTSDYLFLLSRMRFAEQHAPLPPYPENDPSKQKDWVSRRDQLMAAEWKPDDELYQQVADLLGSKRGVAKATTVDTLLSRPDGPHAKIFPSASDITAAFGSLPQQQQLPLLDTWWARLKSPQMIEPLETILDKPQPANEELRLAALRSLMDLDSAKGSARILAEIRRPPSDHQSTTQWAICLSLLPEKTLPQFDEFLVDRLSRESPNDDLDALLVGRYATGAVLSRVHTLYEKNQWDCAAEDGFLRYFLRVDQDFAVARVASQGSSCTDGALDALAAMHRFPEVEPAFISRLDDPDPWAARGAAEVLGKFGSPAAKNARLQRLRTFHETWKSRAQEFRFGLFLPREISDAQTLQSALIEALGAAKGWVLTDDEKLEIQRLELGQR